ncbi:MAG: signal recognition particle-docking protein FtsY [Pseudomonadota bacterium]
MSGSSESPKPGFFRRMFGKKGAEPDNATEPEAAEIAPEPSEIAPEPEPVPAAAVEPETPKAAPESVTFEPPVPGPPVRNDMAPLKEPVAKPDEDPEPVAAPTAPEPAPKEPAPEEPSLGEPGKKSWLSRLAAGLSRSSSQLGGAITGIFTKRKLDQEMLDDLEDALLQADIGIDTAMAITDALAKDRFDKDISADEVRTVLASEVEKVLEPVAMPLTVEAGNAPHVILVVGVNGAGKTTTIGKLAAKFQAEGRTIMLAAGDTFRAAAIEQLQVWGERTGVPVIAGKQGSDASGLAYDAFIRARDDRRDVLIVDTAGRLQNKAELMAELEKIVRVLKKIDESAPHSVLLVLDATTGQNALQQVDIFGKTAGVTGLVMTKLDGTAKGGILVAISAKHKLPVHFIGVGEGVDDLQPFSAADYARAIAGVGSDAVQ